MNRIDLLVEQLKSVQRYAKMTLEGINSDDWFRIPAGCPTHFAWQVGHMTIGKYGLALAIPRGERTEDQELVPTSFREQFGRGSTPDPDPTSQPSVEEILDRFYRVHDRVLAELPTFTEEFLDEPVSIEHPMFDTKFGSLMWSIQHEYTHAGQISLLHRMHGRAPRF